MSFFDDILDRVAEGSLAFLDGEIAERLPVNLEDQTFPEKVPDKDSAAGSVLDNLTFEKIVTVQNGLILVGVIAGLFLIKKVL